MHIVILNPILESFKDILTAVHYNFVFKDNCKMK